MEVGLRTLVRTYRRLHPFRRISYQFWKARVGNGFVDESLDCGCEDIRDIATCVFGYEARIEIIFRAGCQAFAVRGIGELT